MQVMFYPLPAEAATGYTKIGYCMGYISDSLRDFTRQKRGQGVRRKVSGQTKLPGNWMDFLRDPMNKK